MTTPARKLIAALSPRENQICVLVSEGRTNKQIATALRLKPGTVKEYLCTIFLKLDCRSRIELAVRTDRSIRGASAMPTRAKPQQRRPRGGRKE